MKARTIILGALTALLLTPAAAQAHHNEVVPECNRLTLKAVSFPTSGTANGGKNTASFKVETQGTTTTHVLTFTGANAEKTVPFTFYRGDTLKVTHSWKGRSGQTGAEVVFNWTATACAVKPPPPTCENTPSLCPPAEEPPVVTPPVVQPPVVEPPVQPDTPVVVTVEEPVVVDSGPQCVTVSTNARMSRTGRTYRLHGKNMTRVRWYVDGKRAGKGRVHRLKRGHGHVIRVTARVSECQRVALSRRVPQPRPPIIRFAG